MKKILLALALIATLLCVCPLAVFADETEAVAEATAASVAEEVPATEAETGSQPFSPSLEGSLDEALTEGVTTEEPAVHTIFTRVWEYCTENRAEMLGLGGDALIFILALFVKFKNDKKMKLVASDLNVVKGTTGGTAQSQTSVVGAVNGMIDGYNAMKEAYEKYEGTEEDRNRLVAAVMVQNTAILEILSAVYVNNRNIPQGTKDIVNLRYANCHKALGNDETLSAIIQGVREGLDGIQRDESQENVETEAPQIETEA